MQPMKPEQKLSILQNRPLAQPEDIQEYERLLSLRFTRDPDQPQPVATPSRVEGASATLDLSADRELRIQELHRKLFTTPADATPR